MATDPFGDTLRAASSGLINARSSLSAAFDQAKTGTAQQKQKAYELDLLSHETLDIYDRVMSIMHVLDVHH
jgi:hypothetical protein